MYAELQRMVEQSQAELVEAIATRQREAERHAQELARGLENELSQLKRRSSELEAHAQMQDRLLFLQVPTSALCLGRDGAAKQTQNAVHNQVGARGDGGVTQWYGDQKACFRNAGIPIHYS